MTEYTVRLVVELDHPIDDVAARDLAAQWDASLRLDPGLTSVDGTWLAVSGTFTGAPSWAFEFSHAASDLAELVVEAGRTITAWHAIEVVSADETERRQRAAADASIRLYPSTSRFTYVEPSPDSPTLGTTGIYGRDLG